MKLPNNNDISNLQFSESTSTATFDFNVYVTEPVLEELVRQLSFRPTLKDEVSVSAWFAVYLLRPDLISNYMADIKDYLLSFDRFGVAYHHFAIARVMFAEEKDHWIYNATELPQVISRATVENFEDIYLLAGLLFALKIMSPQTDVYQLLPAASCEKIHAHLMTVIENKTSDMSDRDIFLRIIIAAPQLFSGLNLEQYLKSSVEMYSAILRNEMFWPFLLMLTLTKSPELQVSAQGLIGSRSNYLPTELPRDLNF